MSFWDKKAREKRVREREFASDHKHSPYWCERHWAPYRGPGADGIIPNGLLASAKVMEAFLESVEYLELTDKTPQALNIHMQKAEQPLCCRLGDEIMNSILTEAIKYGTHKDEYNAKKGSSRKPG